MAVIKGENMRLLVQDVCVAAATACTVDVSLQVAESDTKDDVDDFIIQEPVGHSWGAEVDAMVDLQPDVEDSVVCDGEQTSYGYVGGMFNIQKGDRIIIASSASDVNVSILALEDNEWVQLGEGFRRLQWTAAEDYEELYIASTIEGDTINYAIGDLAGQLVNFLGSAVSGTPVTVKFAKTIANQHRNRDVEQVLVQGNAIITNITQNATNKDLSTYKVQLQGTGMLSIVE
jgi:hypothetical protein